MQKFFIMLALFVGVVRVCADEVEVRYDILGNQISPPSVFGSIPAYDTQEGKLLVGSLRKVSVVELNLVGVDFINERGDKQGRLCRFKKDAFVLVDGSSTPLYLVGCMKGTYYNRIAIVQHQPPPAAAPVVYDDPRRCEPVSAPAPQVCYRQQQQVQMIPQQQECWSQVSQPPPTLCIPPQRVYCRDRNLIIIRDQRSIVWSPEGYYFSGGQMYSYQPRQMYRPSYGYSRGCNSGNNFSVRVGVNVR